MKRLYTHCLTLLFTGLGKPLSKPLSYKERGFEFSPFRAKKAKHPLSSPLAGGNEGGWEGGWGVRFDLDFSRWREKSDCLTGGLEL